MNTPAAASTLRHSQGEVKVEMTTDQSPVPEIAEYKRRPEFIKLTHPNTHKKYQPEVKRLLRRNSRVAIPPRTRFARVPQTPAIRAGVLTSPKIEEANQSEPTMHAATAWPITSRAIAVRAAATAAIEMSMSRLGAVRWREASTAR